MKRPAFRLGQVLDCARYGPVTVIGERRGWPLCRPVGDGHAGSGSEAYIFCPELVALLRAASNAEAARHLGVNITTVSRWRRMLGIGRMTPGTTAVLAGLALVKFHGRKA